MLSMPPNMTFLEAFGFELFVSMLDCLPLIHWNGSLSEPQLKSNRAGSKQKRPTGPIVLSVCGVAYYDLLWPGMYYNILD